MFQRRARLQQCHEVQLICIVIPRHGFMRPTPTGEFFTAEFKTFNDANGCWAYAALVDSNTESLKSYMKLRRCNGFPIVSHQVVCSKGANNMRGFFYRTRPEVGASWDVKSFVPGSLCETGVKSC